MRVALLLLVAIAAALCALGVAAVATTDTEATQETASISNAAPSKRFLAVFREVQRVDGLNEILDNSIETHNKIRELLVRWCMEDHGSESSTKSILKRNRKNKSKVKRVASRMYAKLTHDRTSRNLREASIDCTFLNA